MLLVPLFKSCLWVIVPSQNNKTRRIFSSAEQQKGSEQNKPICSALMNGFSQLKWTLLNLLVSKKKDSCLLNLTITFRKPRLKYLFKFLTIQLLWILFGRLGFVLSFALFKFLKDTDKGKRTQHYKFSSCSQFLHFPRWLGLLQWIFKYHLNSILFFSRGTAFPALFMCFSSTLDLISQFRNSIVPPSQVPH